MKLIITEESRDVGIVDHIENMMVHEVGKLIKDLEAFDRDYYYAPDTYEPVFVPKSDLKLVSSRKPGRPPKKG